jgi:hypothetical protein
MKLESVFNIEPSRIPEAVPARIRSLEAASTTSTASRPWALAVVFAVGEDETGSLGLRDAAGARRSSERPPRAFQTRSLLRVG